MPSMALSISVSDRAPLFPFGDMAQDYENATPAEREYLRRKWKTHRP